MDRLSIDSQRTTPSGDLAALLTHPAVVALFVFLIVVVVLALAWYAAEQTRCPDCGRLLARELLRKEQIDVRIVREADDYYEGDHNRDIDHVMRTEYRGYYRCKGCAYEWTGTFVEKTEV